MLRADVRGPSATALTALHRRHLGKVERALIRTASYASSEGIKRVRLGMAGAGLGRLGNAIGAKADERLHRRIDGFSASAQFFIRSGSARSRGAIEAYTQGADIRPKRGRWLWVPTNDAQQLVGSGKSRQRLTPGLWREYGMDKKIGPLVTIRSVNGYPLLAVEKVGVDLSGRPRSARALTKKGLPRKGQVERSLVVMFVAIPWTSRAARVSVRAILRQVRDAAENVYYDAVQGRG